MSGGHFQYSGFKIQEALDAIAEDAEVMKRFPSLVVLLSRLGETLYAMEHDLDWDLSSDSHIEDDVKYEEKVIWSLLDAAMRAAPDPWFPRGKWATIQAVDGRHDDEGEAVQRCRDGGGD